MQSSANWKMDLSGIFSEYRRKNGISHQVGDVGKSAMPGFSNLTYGNKSSLSLDSPTRTEKLQVTFSTQREERVKDIERDSGIEILNNKTIDSGSKNSDKFLNSLSNSNTVDDGFVDISSPNDSDSTSSVESKISIQSVRTPTDMAIARIVDSNGGQASPSVRTPQKNVRISLSRPEVMQKTSSGIMSKPGTPQKCIASKPGTPQRCSTGVSPQHSTSQKASCLKKIAVNSPCTSRELDLVMNHHRTSREQDRVACLHKRTMSADRFANHSLSDSRSNLGPPLNIKHYKKQQESLFAENRNYDQLFQNLSLRSEMKSRQEFNSKSDIDDMELLPSYFNSQGFQLDYCWFCGRPMNLNSSR